MLLCSWAARRFALSDLARAPVQAGSILLWTKLLTKASVCLSVAQLVHAMCWGLNGLHTMLLLLTIVVWTRVRTGGLLMADVLLWALRTY